MCWPPSSLVGRAKSNALDKGYDEEAVHQQLWQDRVEPIIAIRDLTEEENLALSGRLEEVRKTVYTIAA